jgi:uncharacterized membrane protein
MIFFDLLLYIHVVLGTISLVIGTCIIILKKGNARHKLLGKIFFSCMLISGIISLALSMLHPNHFLFAIGVFTIYMLLTGKRYLKNSLGKTVHTFDWFLVFIMAIFSSFLFILGMQLLLAHKTFGVVLIVFGAISAMFIYSDVRNYRGLSPLANVGLVTHIQRMTGSYIASLTAFLVVNNTYLPGVIAWLLPSGVLVPFIFIWSRKKARLKKESKEQ